jgi:hypothetical protein
MYLNSSIFVWHVIVNFLFQLYISSLFVNSSCLEFCDCNNSKRIGTCITIKHIYIALVKLAYTFDYEQVTLDNKNMVIGWNLLAIS